MEVCRDRYGDFSPGIFNLWTCAMCYHYLFQDKKELRVNWPLGSSLKATNSSLFHEGQVIYTDITNQTVSRLVCRTLDEYNCKRWRQCCLAAVTCCEKQLLDKRFVPVRPGYCPQTWDGFSCVNEVLKGNTVYITCPPYIDQRSPLGK
ncbi:hypothetical protein SNE40_023009 [Patella caerulea]|uniref:G-protein coupled receptors family 2 profile 1 domain-containing protein n=1 Tax=Patella caerulea TaxID=87958 RepID=A0AAN8G6G7_PATCE